MDRVVGAVRALLSDVLELYSKGLSMFWVAPWVLALVIIPEFAQHVAEISLGMFDSRDAAVALSNHPVRWGFGYAKIAGLLLCFFASARFWWNKANGGRWYDLRNIVWRKLLLGFVLFGVIGVLAEPFADVIPAVPLNILRTILAIISMPFLFLLLAGIFGDRSERHNWRSVLIQGWRYIPLLTLLLVAAYVPLFLLHGLNHRWAMGSPAAVVWALMLFDSLTVGAMAGCVGAAMYLSYRRFTCRLNGTTS